MIKNLPNHYHGLHKRSVIRAAGILVLIIATSYFVYLTGGTETAFTHLMYIPIILSALFFDIQGAVVAAVLGGLALGPIMPKDVSLGLMQTPVSWIFRFAFFLTIGVMIAVLFQCIKTYRAKEIEQSYQDVITGLPNINKLEADLYALMNQESQLSLLGFRIMNMDEINRYTNYEIGAKSLLKAIEVLTAYTDHTIYCLHNNEFVMVLSENGVEMAQLIGTQFLHKMEGPLFIEGFNIELKVRGSLANYPFQADSPKELIKKMDIALDQKTEESGLQLYDAHIEQKSREKFELIVSLFGAIKNDEFYMVYQPKRNLHDASINGVEALLRWRHGGQKQIGPGEFIKIAEEIGMINEITRWVIKEVIRQIKQWQDAGIFIKVALNISQKDLRDSSVIRYLIDALKENDMQPTWVEIELTERSVLENEKAVIHWLKLLREQGIEISLDDFGTGYNSLIGLVKIPVDYIKIDKIFIDHILDSADQIVIESVISYAHKMGKKVIAEGVEDKNQLDILEKMGCDAIQGYYFSKPLPPEELGTFLLRDTNIP